MIRKLIPYAGAEVPPRKKRDWSKPKPLVVKDDRNPLETLIIIELNRCYRELNELEDKRNRLTKRLIEVRKRRRM